jgi:hypothetical protein
MKKILLSIIITLFSFSLVFSQACIPEWTQPGSGIYPDTIINLPPGTPGVPYDFTVQFKVPLVDSSIGQPINIDHILLTGVTGLTSIPASDPFHFTCNPIDCSFKADSLGCVRIQGTPTTEGFYPLTITAKVFINIILFQPVEFSGYHIEVSSTQGIQGISHDKFDVSQNLPNPVNSKTQININLPKPSEIKLKIANVIGNTISNTTINGRQGINTIWIDASEYSPGIYFYSVSDEENSITKRMIVGKK